LQPTDTFLNIGGIQIPKNNLAENKKALDEMPPVKKPETNLDSSIFTIAFNIITGMVKFKRNLISLLKQSQQLLKCLKTIKILNNVNTLFPFLGNSKMDRRRRAWSYSLHDGLHFSPKSSPKIKVN